MAEGERDIAQPSVLAGDAGRIIIFFRPYFRYGSLDTTYIPSGGSVPVPSSESLKSAFITITAMHDGDPNGSGNWITVTSIRLERIEE
jgi:hypothetical protein